VRVGVFFFLFGYPFIFLLPFLLAILAVRAGSRYFGPPPDRYGYTVDRWGAPADMFPYDPYRRRVRSTEAQIFKLAYRLGGRITVSDVVVASGLSVDQVERILEHMVDNSRVRMDIDDEGMVVYEFPEIQARLRERESGNYGSTDDAQRSQGDSAFRTGHEWEPGESRHTKRRNAAEEASGTP